MSAADRILQVKLIADVSEINSKMSGATAEVGRLQGAFSSLKSMAVPAMLGLGATITDKVVGAIGDAITNAGLLREELVSLDSLSISLDLDEGDTRGILDALTSEAQSMGFGDEVAIAKGFKEALAVTEDVDRAIAIVRAGMDLARFSGEELGSSVETAMDTIVAGGEEAEEKLGVFGQTMDERMAAFNTKYGNFAEDFALTDEGEWATINAEFDGFMMDLGTIADEGILEIKRGILDGIEDWKFIFEEAGPIMDKAFKTVWDGLVGIVKGVINGILSAWNALDPQIDFDFDGPGIPNPLGGWVVEPIRFSIHTGDLIPDIPLLAQGGIVTGPTLAMIGEGRHDEAVIPLDGSPLGNTYHITVQAPASSPADVGRAVVEAIEAYERRAGAGWRR